MYEYLDRMARRGASPPMANGKPDHGSLFCQQASSGFWTGGCASLLSNTRTPFITTLRVNMCKWPQVLPSCQDTKHTAFLSPFHTKTDSAIYSPLPIYIYIPNLVRTSLAISFLSRDCQTSSKRKKKKDKKKGIQRIRSPDYATLLLWGKRVDGQI